jgi:hypothetical protein|tara:strand:- start:1589 stop:2185 length:597 start_codon:yes stop_codon:yes gene_type:complete
MKRLLLLFIPLIFLFSCETEEESVVMYDCTNGSCVQSEGGQYSTIEECQAICNCYCGIVTDLVMEPEFEGYLVPDPNNPEELILINSTNSYGWAIININCSGEFIDVCCLPGDFSIGDTFCGAESEEYLASCAYQDDMLCIDISTNQIGNMGWTGIQNELIDGEEVVTYMPVDGISYSNNPPFEGDPPFTIDDLPLCP